MKEKIREILERVLYILYRLCILAAVLYVIYQWELKEIYTIDSDGRIEVNPDYQAVDFVRDLDEPADSMKRQLRFGQNFFVGFYQYLISCYRFEGWEDKPGDYQMLMLSDDERTMLKHVDVNGIYLYKHGKKNPHQFMLESSDRPGSAAVICPLENDVTALIFRTHNYPYEPAKMPIFIIRRDTAVKVFNRNVDVTSISYKDKKLEMTLVDRHQETFINQKGDTIPVGIRPQEYRLMSNSDGELQIIKVRRFLPKSISKLLGL